MYESYVAVAPHPDDFPKLLDRIGEFMSQTFDWSGDIPILDPDLPRTVLPFLDGKRKSHSWAEQAEQSN
jgi:hypothetical protein